MKTIVTLISANPNYHSLRGSPQNAFSATWLHHVPLKGHSLNVSQHRSYYWAHTQSYVCYTG